MGNLLCVGPTKPLVGAVSFNHVIVCKVYLCTFHSPAMQSRRNMAQSPADTPCGVSDEPGGGRQAGTSGARSPESARAWMERALWKPLGAMPVCAALSTSKRFTSPPQAL